MTRIHWLRLAGYGVVLVIAAAAYSLVGELLAIFVHGSGR